MIIMGIDPGTTVLGYGIIEGRGDDIRLVDYNAIKCPSRSSMGQRLYVLYEALCGVIQKYRPDVIAIETPFVSENARTALVIGKAQAVALLAAAANSVPAYEYSPAQIKYNTASYGASSKAQVQEMVRLQLNLEQTPVPSDAADALAAAICHLRLAHLKKITGEVDR